jgi:hypothetical protein
MGGLEPPIQRRKWMAGSSPAMEELKQAATKIEQPL